MMNPRIKINPSAIRNITKHGHPLDPLMAFEISGCLRQLKRQKRFSEHKAECQPLADVVSIGFLGDAVYLLTQNGSAHRLLTRHENVEVCDRLWILLDEQSHAIT